MGLSLDDAVALSMAGFALAALVGDIEDGDAFIDTALALKPNLARAQPYSGWVKALMADAHLVIKHIARGKRRSPHDPQDLSRAIATIRIRSIVGANFKWCSKSN